LRFRLGRRVRLRFGDHWGTRVTHDRRRLFRLRFGSTGVALVQRKVFGAFGLD
jgi:hypothetical protein